MTDLGKNRDFASAATCIMHASPAQQSSAALGRSAGKSAFNIICLRLPINPVSDTLSQTQVPQVYASNGSPVRSSNNRLGLLRHA